MFFYVLFCSLVIAAPVLVPAKVIHALNLKIDDLNSQPRFLGAFDVDYGKWVFNIRVTFRFRVKFSRVINWILCLTSVLLFFLGRCFVSEEECSSLAAEVKHAARRGS